MYRKHYIVSIWCVLAACGTTQNNGTSGQGVVVPQTSSPGSGTTTTTNANPEAPGTPIDTATTHKRLFVTSLAYRGDFGGLSEGDALCQTHADATNLGGQWQAFLSDDETSAYDHIEGSGPWHPIAFATGQLNSNLISNDSPAFASKAALKTVPNNLYWTDERGLGLYDSNANTAFLYWTGSEPGAQISKTCSSWRSIAEAEVGACGATDESRFGLARADEGWIRMGATPDSDAFYCVQKRRLLCLEK